MEQKKVKIAILQMTSIIGDVKANIERLNSMLAEESAVLESSDVLVLPEVWTVGWSCEDFIPSAQELENSSVLEFLSQVAKLYNINIIGGSFISKSGENYYNTCPVFNRDGKLLTTYNKNHLYSYYGCCEGSFITPGNDLQMVTLDGVNYGLSICYDIRFPEVYRAYARSGADILVNCAAWGSNKPVEWEVMTKSRAVENQCYFIAVNQFGKISDEVSNLGYSRVIDYTGKERAIITEGSKIVSCEIDLDELYQFRSKAPILDDIKDKYEVKFLCVR